ncbi:MAG: S8 family serine peptidase [Nitrospirae bacterium]|nr:S8 family serine peptidase [Nitrospirota bacterium]
MFKLKEERRNKTVFSMGGEFMRTKKFLMVFLLVFFATLLASQVPAFQPQTYPLIEGKRLGLVITGNPSYLHKVFVGFRERPGKSEDAIVVRAGGKVKYKYTLVPAIAATVPESAIEGLLRSPQVSYIELDDMVYAIDAELDNSWGVKRIGAGSVHDGGNKGQDVKVAIIDSGIDYTHPDLSANYAGGYDFVNKDNYPFDDNGHGTHVAGIAAAVDNNAGVVGVAPEAWLYALKVLGANGSGRYSDVVAALQWAVDNGMEITNNSYGSSTNPGITVEQAFDNAYNAGLLHVAAAGNSGNIKGTGDNVIYPARYASVIAIAATDNTDKRASFSSTGTAVELAAPGVSINSTVPGGGYASWNGTSMASPHVAGTAALVVASGVTDSNNNGFINDEVRQILNATADDLGITGRDTWYGFGLVNALSAVNVLPPSPIVNVALSADKAEYIRGADTTAILTAVVTNENGNPISGLSSAAFMTTLNGSTVSVTFTETDTQGTYTGDLDILSSLLDGTHTVVVTVTDTAVSGTGSTTFNVVSQTSSTTVTVNSITYAESGKDLLITVSIVDALGNPIAGASVSIDLFRNGVFVSSSTGITGGDYGTVTFRRRNAPKGCYETRVTSVTAEGYTWDGVTPPNGYCKTK